MSDVRNVIIIGSGPAGLTAGIYAARANLKPLMITGAVAGDQLTITTDVENFPGFPDGIMGPDLIENMRKQAEKFGTEMIYDDVSEIDFSKRPFSLKTSDKTFQAHSIIISTGASAKLLGIPAEKKLMGHGVSACATCDGFFFKGKEVAIVGGGDTALEEANFLTKFATKVTVIHRRDQLRASKIMIDKSNKNPKIAFAWNKVVDDIKNPDDKKVSALVLKDTVTGALSDFKTDGLFVAIGHEPNTKLFKGKLEMDETGYLITKNGSKTNVEGVFACGDVQDHVYRQAITAAGSGCMAAIDAERYLESKGISH